MNDVSLNESTREVLTTNNAKIIVTSLIFFLDSKVQNVQTLALAHSFIIHFLFINFSEAYYLQNHKSQILRQKPQYSLIFMRLFYYLDT